MARWVVYEKDGKYRAGKPRLGGLFGIKWQCHFAASYWRPTNFSTFGEASKEVADLNYILDHPEEFKPKKDYWKEVK